MSDLVYEFMGSDFVEKAHSNELRELAIRFNNFMIENKEQLAGLHVPMRKLTEKVDPNSERYAKFVEQVKKHGISLRAIYSDNGAKEHFEFNLETAKKVSDLILDMMATNCTMHK